MAGIDASELAGQGSVLTAGGATPGTPGSGTISQITSTGGTVTITGATGPITNLEVAPGGVSSVISTTPEIVVTTVGAVASLSQIIEADWPIGITRVYALDPAGTNGVAYATPATTSAADYAIACAAAGAAAKTTWAALLAILPQLGNGRNIEIVIAAGAYAETLNWNPVGFANVCIRATGTNATAGVTKFDGSTADCTYLGAATSTGMNAAGYNPTGAPTTAAVQCLKVGGAAPAFPTEVGGNLPWGARWRFDAATTTAAIRNQCRAVAKVAGTDTLTLNQLVWSGLPVASDVFYIESPAAIFTAINLGGGAQVPAVSGQVVVAGLAATGAFRFRDGRFAPAFVSGAPISMDSAQQFDPQLGYTHPVRGFLNVGAPRSNSGTFNMVKGTATLNNVFSVGLASVNNGASLISGNNFNCAVGFVNNGIASYSPATPNLGGLAALGTLPPARIIGSTTTAGIELNGDMAIAQIEIVNCGAHPAIKFVGMTGGRLVLGQSNSGTVTGATGNTDVGLDLTLSAGAEIWIHSNGNTTVTGTLGDVRLNDGTIVSWASIRAAGGLIDNAGNTFTVGGVGAGGWFSGLKVRGVYGAGRLAVDQTLNLLDANGGGLVIDASAAGFTGTYGIRMIGAGETARFDGLTMTPVLTNVAGGTLTLQTTDAQAMLLKTNGATRMTLSSAGVVTTAGSGAAAPGGTYGDMVWTPANATLTLGAPGAPPAVGSIFVNTSTGSGASVGGGITAGILVRDAGAGGQAIIAADSGFLGQFLVGWQSGALTDVVVGAGIGTLLHLQYASSRVSAGSDALTVDGTTGAITLWKDVTVDTGKTMTWTGSGLITSGSSMAMSATTTLSLGATTTLTLNSTGNTVMNVNGTLALTLIAATGLVRLGANGVQANGTQIVTIGAFGPANLTSLTPSEWAVIETANGKRSFPVYATT